MSRSTGIILDPCYSGKGANGLVQELSSNPDRFQGNRILFIHTGKYTKPISPNNNKHLEITEDNFLTGLFELKLF